MVIDSTIRVHSSELSTRQWEKLLISLTFFDADGDEITAYRLKANGDMLLPRGVLDRLPKKMTIADDRVRPSQRKLRFIRQLDMQSAEKSFSGQQKAVDAMVKNEQGLIIAQPGFGKTQVALAFAAACGTPTLVIVHTLDILKQWQQYAQASMPDAEIGVIQGKTHTIGHVTIAMVQTVKQQLENDNFWRQFGCVIFDEAHHAAADTWEWICNTCPAYYRFGFTATKNRADKMHPLLQMNIGPIIFEQKFTPKVDLSIVPVVTGFQFNYRGAYDWQRLLRTLSKDERRNTIIAQIVDREIAAGNVCLVLSRHITHLEEIAKLIDSPRIAVLTGKTKDREQIIADLRRGKLMCVLATQLADEALDVPLLSRVFLTFPGKHDGRIIQQIGRAIREHPRKVDAKVYDFIDDMILTLAKQASERMQTYRKLKIVIEKGESYAPNDRPQEDRGSHLRKLMEKLK